MKSEVQEQHKTVKKDSYWSNLTDGSTGAYKEQVIDELIKKNGPHEIKSILDVGCGTCELIFRYQEAFNTKLVTCLDYDPKVISQLQQKFSEKKVNWVVGDVFELNKTSDKYDLIFLLDMIHEIYSFYGRPTRELQVSVDHELGIQFVQSLLKNIVSVVNHGGGIVITDNILCEERCRVEVEIKTDEAQKAVAFFLQNYPTKKIDGTLNKNILSIDSWDFCILLTQYNKIKNENWDRWNVEKFEIHQYFTNKDYADFFGAAGFNVFVTKETPKDAKAEWESDFKVLSGLNGLPDKRITLLAVKNK